MMLKCPVCHQGGISRWDKLAAGARSLHCRVCGRQLKFPAYWDILAILAGSILVPTALISGLLAPGSILFFVSLALLVLVFIAEIWLPLQEKK